MMPHNRIFFSAIALIVSIQCLDAQNASFPLPSKKIFEYPFNMVGKVQSGEIITDLVVSINEGSGVAISQKIVLSAAHIFFDRDRIDWMPGPFRWNLRHSPSNKSWDLSARSYHVFSDYAEASRLFDFGGSPSREQENRDIMLLIFYEDVADGGWARWGVNRINTNIDKMIVGYPSGLYSYSDPRTDMMHSTSLEGSPARFTLFPYADRRDRMGLLPRVYWTHDLSSGPGVSGGPVFGLIPFTDGTFDWGVVGIVVGGFGPTSVNAVKFNWDVYDLLREAEANSDSILFVDHGDTRITATTVELNHSIPGNLETEGDIDYFRFYINSTGTITAFTTGDTDTLGTLQNNSGNVITTNDDSGSGDNFLITRVINPGTYYIAVSNLSYEETGNYTFYVDFTTTINLPDLTVDFISADRRSVVAGETVRVDFHRSNKGVEDSGEFSHGIYLSKDKIITTEDTQLVYFAKASVSAGVSKQMLFYEITIPENTISGIYYIGYILDFDMKIQESDETNNTGFAEIILEETISDDDGALVLGGLGDIAGEDIQHPNGNVFDQVLLTGPHITLKANPGQITRASFMDEDEDIVQVEFSGAGRVTVTLDPATYLPPSWPSRYNQQVKYVTGKPSVLIERADFTTFLSIFTVGRINAVNQALFPEGQVYDAMADVTLVEVKYSKGFGGMQLSNTVFSRGSNSPRYGVIARRIPIAVRLTIGDFNPRNGGVPHILFGSGSFTVPAANSGVRITGGILGQYSSILIVIAESGSLTPGFDTLITTDNFKSDGSYQPKQKINPVFINENASRIPIDIR